MSEKKVIILDETKDDEQELTLEEIEEKARMERLRKHYKKHSGKRGSIYLKLCKIGCVIGILGIMFSMFTVSGIALVVSLIILLVCGTVNYFFYK